MKIAGKVGLSVFNVKIQRHKASLQDGSTHSSTTVTKIEVKLIAALLHKVTCSLLQTTIAG